MMPFRRGQASPGKSLGGFKARSARHGPTSETSTLVKNGVEETNENLQSAIDEEARSKSAHWIKKDQAELENLLDLYQQELYGRSENTHRPERLEQTSESSNKRYYRSTREIDQILMSLNQDFQKCKVSLEDLEKSEKTFRDICQNLSRLVRTWGNFPVETTLNQKLQIRLDDQTQNQQDSVSLFVPPSFHSSPSFGQFGREVGGGVGDGFNLDDGSGRMTHASLGPVLSYRFPGDFAHQFLHLWVCLREERREQFNQALGKRNVAADDANRARNKHDTQQIPNVGETKERLDGKSSASSSPPSSSIPDLFGWVFDSLGTGTTENKESPTSPIQNLFPFAQQTGTPEQRTNMYAHELEDYGPNGGHYFDTILSLDLQWATLSAPNDVVLDYSKERELVTIAKEVLCDRASKMKWVLDDMKKQGFFVKHLLTAKVLRAYSDTGTLASAKTVEKIVRETRSDKTKVSFSNIFIFWAYHHAACLENSSFGQARAVRRLLELWWKSGVDTERARIVLNSIICAGGDVFPDRVKIGKEVVAKVLGPRILNSILYETANLTPAKRSSAHAIILQRLLVILAFDKNWDSLEEAKTVLRYIESCADRETEFQESRTTEKSDGKSYETDGNSEHAYPSLISYGCVIRGMAHLAAEQKLSSDGVRNKDAIATVTPTSNTQRHKAGQANPKNQELANAQYVTGLLSNMMKYGLTPTQEIFDDVLYLWTLVPKQLEAGRRAEEVLALMELCAVLDPSLRPTQRMYGHVLYCWNTSAASYFSGAASRAYRLVQSLETARDSLSIDPDLLLEDEAAVVRSLQDQTATPSLSLYNLVLMVCSSTRLNKDKERAFEIVLEISDKIAPISDHRTFKYQMECCHNLLGKNDHRRQTLMKQFRDNAKQNAAHASMVQGHDRAPMLKARNNKSAKWGAPSTETNVGDGELKGQNRTTTVEQAVSS